MQIENPVNITIDGTDHPVAGFSEQVQRLVAIHTEWRNQLQTQRLEVAKTEAAIRSLDAELSQLVAKELNPEPVVTDAGPVDAAPAADSAAQ